MRNHRTPLIILIVICTVLLTSAKWVGCSNPDPQPEHRGGSEASSAGLNVALLKSGYTSRYFAEKWQYEQVIYTWLTFLAESGIEHRLVSDSELEQGGMTEFTVLVLPAALCLSEEERVSVREFLADGRGVVASWAVGVRSRNGEWAGWGFVEELTRARFAGYIPGRPAAWVTLSGRSPLSVGLGAGHRLELVGGWKVALSRSERDGYWSDYNLDPWVAEGETRADVAVVHNARESGRAVWLGFSAAEVISNQVNRAALRKLLLNALNWTGRMPISHVWHWPEYRQAAAVFSQDVEYLFHNAASSVEVLKEEGIEGTFFCVSDLASDNSDLVRALAQVGEVGTHSDDHRQFKGQDFNEQYERLEKSSNALKEMGAVTVKGMRPPYELCDDATLKAWAILGGEYVFGQPEYNPRMMPQLYRVEEDPSHGLYEEKTLVLLPRAVRDDHTTLVVEALEENDAVFEAHRSDMERVYSLSGLCMFGYHSNIICLPERVEILSRLIRYAKTLDLWLTTAGDVARWWRMREGVSVEVTRREDGGMDLTVKNAGAEAVDGISAVVYLPSAASEVRITCDSPDTPPPRHILEGEKLIVYFDSVEADTLKSYTLEIL